MKTFLSLVLICSSLILHSCGGSSSVPSNVDTKEPNKGPNKEFQFHQQFLDVVEFEQGRNASYNMIEGVTVPAPGTPVLTMTGLPDGASFDGKILSWTPSCDISKDFFQNRDYRIVPVMTKLTSDINQDDFVERHILLVVHRFIEFKDRSCGQF